MANKTVKIFLSWLLVVSSMLIIFYFSSEPGTKSTNTSQGVTEEVLDIVMKEEDITPEVVKKANIPIRKIAHFGIYLLLGFCLLNAFIVTMPVGLISNCCFSLGVAILYAISDEFHQNFTAGRGPQFTDVVIDSLGSLCGIALFFGFYYLYNNKIKSRKI